MNEWVTLTQKYRIRFEFVTAVERDNWVTEIETITYRYADNWNRNGKQSHIGGKRQFIVLTFIFIVKRFSMFTRESAETAPRPRPMPKKGTNVIYIRTIPKRNCTTKLAAPPATVPALEKRVSELENELVTLKKQFDEERQYYIKQIQVRFKNTYIQLCFTHFCTGTKRATQGEVIVLIRSDRTLLLLPTRKFLTIYPHYH